MISEIVPKEPDENDFDPDWDPYADGSTGWTPRSGELISIAGPEWTEPDDT